MQLVWQPVLVVFSVPDEHMASLSGSHPELGKATAAWLKQSRTLINTPFINTTSVAISGLYRIPVAQCFQNHLVSASHLVGISAVRFVGAWAPRHKAVCFTCLLLLHGLLAELTHGAGSALFSTTLMQLMLSETQTEREGPPCLLPLVLCTAQQPVCTDGQWEGNNHCSRASAVCPGRPGSTGTNYIHE